MQACPTGTEAPWFFGSKERSHRFLHKRTNEFSAQPGCDPGSNLQRLLGEFRVGGNFNSHPNMVVSHYLRFGVLPPVPGENETATSGEQSIALIQSS